MPNPQGEYGLSVVDYSKEVSTSRVNTVVLNAGNIAAQTTAAGTYLTTVQNIILGNLTRTSLVAILTAFAPSFPTDVNAQRERKWLVRAFDGVTLSRFQWTLPTADFSGTKLLPNSDFADMSETDIAAFVTAAEAFVRSPEGNAITILDMVGVGRNL